MAPFGTLAAVCRCENRPAEATGSSPVGAQTNRAMTPEINRATQVRKDGSRGKTLCSTGIPRVASVVSGTPREAWWIGPTRASTR